MHREVFYRGGDATERSPPDSRAGGVRAVGRCRFPAHLRSELDDDHRGRTHHHRHPAAGVPGSSIRGGSAAGSGGARPPSVIRTGGPRPFHDDRRNQRHYLGGCLRGCGDGPGARFTPSGAMAGGSGRGVDRRCPRRRRPVRRRHLGGRLVRGAGGALRPVHGRLLSTGRTRRGSCHRRVDGQGGRVGASTRLPGSRSPFRFVYVELPSEPAPSRHSSPMAATPPRTPLVSRGRNTLVACPSAIPCRASR